MESLGSGEGLGVLGGWVSVGLGRPFVGMGIGCGCGCLVVLFVGFGLRVVCC